MLAWQRFVGLAETLRGLICGVPEFAQAAPHRRVSLTIDSFVPILCARACYADGPLGRSSAPRRQSGCSLMNTVAKHEA